MQMPRITLRSFGPEHASVSGCTAVGLLIEDFPSAMTVVEQKGRLVAVPIDVPF